MQPTQVIPLLGIPVDSPSITLSLSVKELNTPRHERRCLLIHEYVAEPELQIALHGVNDSSNSWRLIRTVIIFTESVIPPQAQTTSRMRSISVNGLVTFHLGERSGTFPELPYDHFLFGITAYAYVCTWGWGVVIETTHTMGTWRQGAFDCFLSWTELLAIDKGLMA